MFYYDSGELIKTGDEVLGPTGRRAVVKAILVPESDEAMDYGFPEGGVLIEEDWGRPNLILLTDPSDGTWSDMRFLRRVPQ